MKKPTKQPKTGFMEKIRYEGATTRNISSKETTVYQPNGEQTKKIPMKPDKNA
jgi:hypothetical protein